jgi:flagellin
MVALNTLKGINANLGQVQSEISTGKSINSARDNAAIWSISTVMESDVDGFEQISNSLNLGSATVGVAREASESIVEELKSIRDNVIAAQESNVDRTKIQTDITESVELIQGYVNGAQFNGQNLLNESGSVSILASLDRSSTGVTAAQINVDKANLTTDAGTTATLAASDAGGATFASSGLDGSSSAITDVTAITINTAAAGEADGNVYDFTIAGQNITYTATATDTQDTIASELTDRINAAGITGLTAAVDGSNANEIDFTSSVDASITANAADQTKVDEAGGAFEGLDSLSVLTDGTAATALSDIEGFLTSAIDAAAEFGSKQKRIDSQTDFVSSLSDSLKTGISTLTDANLEEASARLQALQVQQQLGVQALSIANQAPQALLGLFR